MEKHWNTDWSPTQTRRSGISIGIVDRAVVLTTMPSSLQR